MRINGIPISQEEVIRYVEKFKSSIEELRPSFFELTTAMAFDYFAKEEVDIAVIEGWHGWKIRLHQCDMNPEVSIITSDWGVGSSTVFLGNTLEEITKRESRG